MARWLMMLLLGWTSACTGDVVAVVGDTPIPRADLQAATQLAAMALEPGVRHSESMIARLTSESLQALIDTELLRQALAEAHGPITALATRQYVNAHKGNYNDEQFEEMLVTRSIDVAAWEREQEHRFIVEQYMEHVLVPNITIDEEKMHAYYKEHRNAFREPAAVKARHIVTASAKEAKAVRRQILSGDNFAQLAMEHSIAMEAADGGALGWIVKGQYPEVFETCFRLPIGAVSQVVKSPFGYHLFKTIERREARLRPLTEVRESIVEQLTQAIVTTRLEEQLAELRAKTTITIRPEAVKRVALQP